MSFVDLVLFIHVIFGVLSLFSGLVLLLLFKGGQKHRVLGWIYTASMTGVFVTSIYVSLVKSNIFLLLVGFFSFYLVHTGVRYRYVAKTGIKLSDKIFTWIYGAIYLVLVLYALYGFYLGAKGLGLVLLAFGLIGFSLWINDFRLFILAQTNRIKFWLNEHIGRMIGSYISAVTAFAVNNIQFEPNFIVWLTPAVLGAPLIAYFTRKYTRK